MSAADKPAKRLSIVSLGKLLCLAEVAKKKQEEVTGTMAQQCADSLRETRDRAAGIETHSPERDVELFLRSLHDEAKRDVLGLFYLGRNAGDNFNGLRVNTGVNLEVMPWFIAGKVDLHDSLIKGLKRFAECGSAVGEEDTVWVATDAVVFFPPDLDGVHWVEWSDLQRAYHIALLTDSLRSNFRQWLDGEVNDYRPIALSHSKEDAHVIIEHMQKLRPDYEKPKEIVQ